MTDPRFDPVMKAALDRFTVPPLPPGFTDRVVAAAMSGESVSAPSLLPPSGRRGPRRGAWRRPSRIVAGALAMSLISAAAAATGYLGDRAQTITRDLPVVGPMIAQVVPADRPKARPVRTKPMPKPEAPAMADVQPAANPSAPADIPPALLPRELRRERIAERIVTGLERRAERRAALGLPDRPPRPREAMAVIRRIPPADRREVIRRVRALRAERAATGISAEPLRRPVMVEDSSLPVPDAQVIPPTGTDLPVTKDRMAEGDAGPGDDMDSVRRADRAERIRRFRELRQRRLEQLREQAPEQARQPD